MTRPTSAPARHLSDAQFPLTRKRATSRVAYRWTVQRPAGGGGSAGTVAPLPGPGSGLPAVDSGESPRFQAESRCALQQHRILGPAPSPMPGSSAPSQPNSSPQHLFFGRKKKAGHCIAFYLFLYHLNLCLPARTLCSPGKALGHVAALTWCRQLAHPCVFFSSSSPHF